MHNVVIGPGGVPFTNTIEYDPDNYLEITRLLLDKKMDPNFDNDGRTLTPLMRACETGGAQQIKLLVEHGANVNHQR